MNAELMPVLQVAVALMILGVGLVAGIGVHRQRNRALRARVAELERDLETSRFEFHGYRDRVEKHFGQTSDLFRDLTVQYTALYAHLAEGARELCPERVPELGRGFEAALLNPSTEAQAPQAAAPSSAAETADKAEDASSGSAAESRPA